MNGDDQQIQQDPAAVTTDAGVQLTDVAPTDTVTLDASQEFAIWIKAQIPMIDLTSWWSPHGRVLLGRFLDSQGV